MAPFLGLRGSHLKIAITCLVVVPTFILFGFNNGSTGGILTLEDFVRQFPQIDTVNSKGTLRSHNSRIKGVVTGVYDLGAVVGSLACIGYSDRIGRLKTIFIGLILSLIGLTVEASAYALAQFVIGRLVVGLAIGTISAAVPVWQSECSGKAHRGAFVLIEGVCISFGITLSEWIEFAFYMISPESLNWRIPLAFPALFSLFCLPFLFFMPESPRWLAKKGRMEEAQLVLAALEDKPVDSPQVLEEMSRIAGSLEVVRGNLKDLLHNGRERVLNRTLLAMGTQMFQQMCGISTLIFYTTTVFSDLGYTGTLERVLACTLATSQTLSSLLPLFLIDRVGRRKLFMSSLAGMAVCMAVISGTAGSKNRSVGKVAVAFFFLYEFFFPLGLLGQPFLYATEVAPLKFRVPITAIANATQWLSQFIVAQVTPLGAANLGTKYYIIYAVINACGVVMIYLFYPETSGRSLEEMDQIFEQSTGYLKVVSVSKRMARQPNGENMYQSDGLSSEIAVKSAYQHVEAIV